MSYQYGVGDDVFYRGAQFPWGHAVVVHVSDAGYVLELDHCGEVVVGLDEVMGLTVPDGPAEVVLGVYIPPPTTGSRQEDAKR